MEYKSIVSDELRESLERFTSDPEAMAEAEKNLENYRKEQRKQKRKEQFVIIISGLLFSLDLVIFTILILLCE